MTSRPGALSDRTPERPRHRLALALSESSVTLYQRQNSGGWQAVGDATPGSDDFPHRIDALRVEALLADPDRTPVLIWLPPEQVLERHLDLSGTGPRAEHRAARTLAEATPYKAQELSIALAPPVGREPRLVLAALRQTVQEAHIFVSRWGFVPGDVSTRGHDATFGPGGPTFSLREPVYAGAGRTVTRLAAASLAVAAIGAAAFGNSWLAPEPELLVDNVKAHAVTIIRAAKHETSYLVSADHPTAPHVGDLRHLSWPIMVLEPGGTTPPAIAATRSGEAPEGVRLAALGPTDLPLPDALAGPARPQDPDVLVAPVAPVPAPEIPERTDTPPVEETDSPDNPKAVALSSPVPRARPAVPQPELATAPVDAPAPPAPSAREAEPEVQTLQAAALEPEPQVTPAPLPAVRQLVAPPAEQSVEEGSPSAVAVAPPPQPRPQELAAGPVRLAVPQVRVGKIAPRRVGRAAVERGLILNDTSLIGIIDARSGREALVRLPTGNYRRVSRGDKLDGWQVSAISGDSMRLTRNGQRRVLLLVTQ